MSTNKKIKISAVGDISFAGNTSLDPIHTLFQQVKTAWTDSDLVIGNLESPLLTIGTGVPGKCVLKANPRWAQVLASAGINMVSLANNHVMDYGPDGLFSTMEALKKVGILFVGAGANQDAALKPLYMSLNGQKLAFIARSSVVVSSQCYATENTPGAAHLDINQTKVAIRECQQQADIVVVLLHWGIDNYSYPSPFQRIIARELIKAGADFIFGHHPHVLQGAEKIGNGLVCYSLGHFVFSDFLWSFLDKDGKRHDRIVTLTKDNRKGVILNATLAERRVESYEFLPILIQPDGRVEMDNTAERRREIDSLSSLLQWTAYTPFWRAYSLKQEWELRLKPLISGKLAWSKLKKLRLEHLSQLLNIVHRSSKITIGKSTNPYE